MKALQEIKKALLKIGNNQEPTMNSTYSKETYQYFLGLWKQAVIAQKVLPKLNTLIEQMESEELVDKIAEAINDGDTRHALKWEEIRALQVVDGYLVAKSCYKHTNAQAQAVLNVIKEL